MCHFELGHSLLVVVTKLLELGGHKKLIWCRVAQHIRVTVSLRYLAGVLMFVDTGARLLGLILASSSVSGKFLKFSVP